MRYAITLEYDGTDFAGFQWQSRFKTVQSELEAAIQKSFKLQSRVAAASRTDAGVHARGQIAAFDLARQLDPARLVAAINSKISPAIRIIAARLVPSDWQPRYASQYKIYTYQIYNREIFSPFRRGQAWQVATPLDLAAMRRSAAKLVGRHNFKTFCASGSTVLDHVRQLDKITISKKHDLITLRFQGTGFLYHMVRNLVGSLVEVGRGRWSAQQLVKILHSQDRRQAGPTAPAAGLYLEQVKVKWNLR